MTSLHDNGPLGVAKHGASLTEVITKNVQDPQIKQVIGLTLLSTGTITDQGEIAEVKIAIGGKRWPGDGVFFDDENEERPDEAKLGAWISQLQSPSFLPREGANKSALPPGPLDIRVQHKSLIFLTTNITNLHFSSHVIARKQDVNFDTLFQDNSVRVLADGKTAFWNSEYIPPNVNPVPTSEQYGYNILAEFRQQREKLPLTLPIIIDPGTNNGGVGGWPT